MQNDAVAGLIRALIANMRGAPEGWESLAMVVALRGARVAGTHGYVYSADGTASAVASRPSAIQPAVDAVALSRLGPDAQPPVSMLLQFDRTTGSFELTFEDSDPDRWRVTPANIDTIAGALRPPRGGSG